MTVQEAITLLQALPDRAMAIMIDCPYCGRGHQLERIDEMVVLSNGGGKEKSGDD